jgi:hypothetical protein
VLLAVDQEVVETLGLQRLYPAFGVRVPDAENPPVRFDEREVETGYGRASEAPADERPGTDRPVT